MSNKKKINKLIKELEKNKGFIDMVNVGLFISQGINISDETSFEVSVIEYNENTYENLQILNRLFDIVISLNQIVDLYYDNDNELGSNQYKETLYGPVSDDIFKRLKEIFYLK